MSIAEHFTFTGLYYMGKRVVSSIATVFAKTMGILRTRWYDYGCDLGIRRRVGVLYQRFVGYVSVHGMIPQYQH